MEYAEFWLLESAVRYVVPIGRIVGDDESLRLRWNKPSHQASRGELARLLRGLLRAGYVKCSLGGKEVTPTDEELMAALDYERLLRRGMAPALSYALTTKGAQCWEQYAHPNWDRYHEVILYEAICQITTGSAEMLDRLLEVGPSYWRIIVIGGAENRVLLQPWHATYWKTLPQGHRVRLQFVREPPLSDPETAKARLAELESAHRKNLALKYWYTPLEPPNTG